MPIYRAHFTETVEYSVEFETETPIDPNTHDGWFEAMEADPANIDWLANAEVTERTLNELERLCDVCGLATDDCDCESAPAKGGA